MKQPPLNFTLIEMLVVIAIIAILSALLFPALKNAKEASLSVKCVSNLKQTGIALFSYGNDYNGWTPKVVDGSPNVTWDQRLCLDNYISPMKSGGNNALVCPSFATAVAAEDNGNLHRGEWFKYGRTYGLNRSWSTNRLKITQSPVKVENNYGGGCADLPERLPLVGDTVHQNGLAQDYRLAQGKVSGYPGAYPIHLRHAKKCNLLFADGHATSLTKESLFNNYRFDYLDLIY